jgi:N-acetylneuraminic acid mutarotase
MIAATNSSLVVLAWLAAMAGSRAAEGWLPLAPSPVALQEVAVAEVDGRVYVVGGFDAARQSVNTALRYDPVTDAWERLPDLPAAAPLNHLGAVGCAGRLFVFGGLRGDFSPVDTVWSFDPATGRWEPRAPLPAARGGFGAAVLDGRIYVVGGLPATRAADFAAYDPERDAWTALPPLPTPRDHLAVAAAGGRIYAIGGRQVRIAAVRAEVEVFDPATARWRSLGPMPTPRGGMAVAALGDRIFLFGGEGNPADPRGMFADVECFDPGADRWRRLGAMPVPRHGTGGAVVGGRIHVPAGAPVIGFGTTPHHDAFTPPAAP